MTARFDESAQRDISRLVIKTGQMLLQHGAESRLVADLSCRIGEALGLDSVEISLSASSMVVTTLTEDHCITTARRSPDRGINMHVVSEVQRTVIMVEKGILDFAGARKRLERIRPLRYNRWLVVLMIGLSCASFSRLAGGDWMIFAVTFVASSIGMIVRQEFAHRHFNPLLNFGVTAFVTTSVAGLAEVFNTGNQPFIAMASAVLMLVPGFPLINAVSDMVKGYVNMGIARWVFASLLTLSTCLGIIGAMNLIGAWGWV